MLFLTGDSYYWFFSTIAQTLGAIVGVVGMLTVFRLQNITNSLQKLLDDTFNQRSSVFGGEVAIHQTPDSFITDFDKKFPEPDITLLKKGSTRSVIFFAQYRIGILLNSKSTIGHGFFVWFLIPQLIGIFASLGFLLGDETWANVLDEYYPYSLWIIAGFLLYLFGATAHMIKVLLLSDTAIDTGIMKSWSKKRT